MGVHTEKFSDFSVRVLKSIVKSLVATQRYKSVKEAIDEIALAAVQKKIAYYQRRIRKFERKYGIDFDAFDNRLKGGSSLSEEDDRFEWRSDLSMVNDWKTVLKEIKVDNKRHLETAEAVFSYPKFRNNSV